MSLSLFHLSLEWNFPLSLFSCQAAVTKVVSICHELYLVQYCYNNVSIMRWFFWAPKTYVNWWIKILLILTLDDMMYQWYIHTVKPVSNCHSKVYKTTIVMTNRSFMNVKSITECSPWSILQYLWPALSDNWSWKPIFSLLEWWF